LDRDSEAWDCDTELQYRDSGVQSGPFSQKKSNPTEKATKSGLGTASAVTRDYAPFNALL
jgi:hypothetical protein